MVSDLQLAEFIYEQPAAGNIEFTFKQALNPGGRQQLDPGRNCGAVAVAKSRSNAPIFALPFIQVVLSTRDRNLAVSVPRQRELRSG